MAQVRKRHADVVTGLHSNRTHAARHQAWHLTNRTLLPLARRHLSAAAIAKRLRAGLSHRDLPRTNCGRRD